MNIRAKSCNVKDVVEVKEVIAFDKPAPVYPPSIPQSATTSANQHAF